ncbi:MAG: helix-turn-helix domain-containing protein [Bryobacterales bacterium]|nr:helix-turn-helix domain-containing protein [Bryobacterales bacterium]
MIEAEGKMSRHSEIGRYLASLREKANLKQNELARRLEWSPAVLSRVESGERSLSSDELEIILNGIATPEAERLKELLARNWQILPEPSLSDSESDLLWEAEQTAQSLHSLSENPEVRQIFERRLIKYREEVKLAANNVAEKRYNASFLGTIAVGKSTAICRLENLELASDKGMPKPVLETGAGGITICEVHIRRGPGYGLIVEPASEEEIRRYVGEFANFLLNPTQPARPAEPDGDGGSPGISREVERALRNMTGLRNRRREKKPDGTIIPALDEARTLASTIKDAKALSVELLARMELHKRDRRDIWYSESVGKPPYEWLQETFERINNGKHSDFTIPRRIELLVPTAVMGEESLSVTIIDTQGIDDIAERADLEQHFDDAHTAVILCSVFNEAPATAVRQLLTRAKEGGVRTLGSHAAILALPRPGEALAVKDNGVPVETATEGYEVKEDEVRLKLSPLGLSDLPVMFFNAAEDSRETLRAFIRDRIDIIREAHRKSLREIIAGANALMANYAREQARETMRQAARHLTVWLDRNASLHVAHRSHVQDSLLSAVASAHPRSIHAAVVREGEWQQLNYAHQLSHGARRIATQILEPKLSEFRAIADNLLNDEQYLDAHDLVRQAIRILEGGFDTLVRKAQLVGQSIHADELRPDSAFWTALANEWGQGGGYRDRINAHNRNWFVQDRHGEADARVVDLICEEWGQTTNALRGILSQE